MINEWWNLSGAFLAGMAVGGIFFGGLWWTTQRLMTTKHPAVLLLLSFLSRTAVVLGVFFLVGNSHLMRWLVCLAGFLMARLFLLCWSKKTLSTQPASRAGENWHETES